MEKQMKTLILVLAVAAGLGLAVPAFATDKTSAGQSSAQVVRADPNTAAAYTDISAQERKAKKKKKGTTSRSSWGG